MSIAATAHGNHRSMQRGPLIFALAFAALGSAVRVTAHTTVHEH
jgi:hypothetical protein